MRNTHGVQTQSLQAVTTVTRNTRPIKEHTNPKPLYDQFAAERSGQFSWDYLEEGPEVWRVRIGRPAAA